MFLEIIVYNVLSNVYNAKLCKDVLNVNQDINYLIRNVWLSVKTDILPISKINVKTVIKTVVFAKIIVVAKNVFQAIFTITTNV